jgi:hypothetical protein
VAAPVPSVAAPAPVLAAPVLHAPTAVPVLSAAPLLYDSVEVEEEAMSATYPLSSPLPTLSPLSPSPLSAASLSALCGLSLRSLRPLSPLSAASPPPAVASPVLVNSAAKAKPNLPWISDEVSTSPLVS